MVIKETDIMKRITLVVIAVVLCLALTSCPYPEDAENAIGNVAASLRLPPMKLPSEVQSYLNFAGAQNVVAVTTIAEAVTLFNSATDVLTGNANTGLKSFDNLEYNARFTDAYNADAIAAALDDQTSATFTVKIDDITRIPVHTSVTKGSINGSSTFTVSTNGDDDRTLRDIQNKADTVIYAKNGDMKTLSYNGDRTFAITDGFILDGNIRVAGYVTISHTESAKKTLTEQVNRIFTNNTSNETKFSLTLTVANVSTNRGAKFRLSGIQKNSGATTRNVISTGNMVISNLEVYSYNNNHVFSFTNPTVPVDNPATVLKYAAWFTFAKEVIAKNTQNF